MRNTANRIINILGIDLADKDVLAYIGEDLLTLQEDKVFEFVNYVRDNHNASYLNYKKPYQKFIILMDNFKNKSLVITEKELDTVHLFCDLLYRKITWYFDLLQDLLPTKKQLERQIWKNHQYNNKDLINKKEEQVVDAIGDTVYIYRLATMNKPLLQEKILEITKNLVKQKKTKQLLLNNSKIKMVS